MPPTTIAKIKNAQYAIEDSVETLEKIAEEEIDEFQHAVTSELLGLACRLNSLIKKIETTRWDDTRWIDNIREMEK